MQLLLTDDDALAHVRSFFGGLPAALGIQVESQEGMTEAESIAEAEAVPT